MRFESHDAQPRTQGLGALTGMVDDVGVAEVDAVEISHGDRRAGQTVRQVTPPFNNDHVASSHPRLKPLPGDGVP